MNEHLRDRDETELHETSKGLNLRTYLQTFRRKAGLIAGITGLTTFIAFLITLRDPSIYAGDLQLLVEPVTSADKLTDPSTLTRTGGIPDERLLSLDYPTQLEILKGPDMLLSIAQEVQLHNPVVDVSNLAGKLQENLSVKRIGNTSKTETKIIEVSYEGENPELTEQVLEATALKYLEHSIEERKKRIGAGVEFIDEQLPQLRERLAGLQSQKRDLQQQYQSIDPNTRGEEIYSQVHQLTQQEQEIQGQLRELKTLQSSLQRRLNLSADEALVASTLSQDPNRTRLIAQLQEVKSQIAIDSARYSEENPALRKLLQQKENLQQLLDQETQQILAQNSATLGSNSSALGFQDATRLNLIGQLVDTASQIETLEARYQSVSDRQQLLFQQAEQFPEAISRTQQLEQQISSTNQILDQLLTQRENLRVEVAQNDVPWEVFREPRIETDANGVPLGSPPERQQKLLIGALGGIFLGMLAAIWLERRQDIFYTSDPFDDELALPLLGEIPVDDRWEPNNLASRPSFFNRAFEALYAKLSLSYSNPPIRSLVISSVESKDGQSTVALNLARTAAAAGNRVLLVDANLDNPQLHAWLGLNNRQGLINLLEEPRNPEEFIERSPQANLFVLTAGVPLSKASGQLWSAQMEQLMKTLQGSYDLVIYDPPHFFDSTSIGFLAAHTDGVALVVGVQKTSASAVKKAVEQAETLSLPILGIIANHPVLMQEPPYPLKFDQPLSESAATPIADEADVYRSQR